MMTFAGRLDWLRPLALAATLAACVGEPPPECKCVGSTSAAASGAGGEDASASSGGGAAGAGGAATGSGGAGGDLIDLPPTDDYCAEVYGATPPASRLL